MAFGQGFWCVVRGIPLHDIDHDSERTSPRAAALSSSVKQILNPHDPKNISLDYINKILLSRASSDGNNGVDLFQLFPTDLKVRKSQSANLGKLFNSYIK